MRDFLPEEPKEITGDDIREAFIRTVTAHFAAFAQRLSSVEPDNALKGNNLTTYSESPTNPNRGWCVILATNHVARVLRATGELIHELHQRDVPREEIMGWLDRQLQQLRDTDESSSGDISLN